MKQTAVEWLIEQLKDRAIDLNKWNCDLIEQAKEMEKQQIINVVEYYCPDTSEAEQYYNEIFKSE